MHQATPTSGERVAVKVQYPEIEALVRSDLANLRVLFRTVDFMERDFDLMPLVDELASYVPRELNFVNEGHNAETVARMFAGRDDVMVPRIHWQLTTRRVLVMEFIDGIKITDVAGLKRAGIDTNKVARLLAEAYCEQILRHGFFHADPHPGNILVQRRADGEPRLVLLDFGLAKDLPPRFRDGVVCFAAALLQGRKGEMAQALVDLGFETRRGGPGALDAIAAFLLDAAIQLRQRGFLDRNFAAELRPRALGEGPRQSGRAHAEPPGAGRPRAGAALRGEPRAGSAHRPDGDDPALRDDAAGESRPRRSSPARSGERGESEHPGRVAPQPLLHHLGLDRQRAHLGHQQFRRAPEQEGAGSVQHLVLDLALAQAQQRLPVRARRSSAGGARRAPDTGSGVSRRAGTPRAPTDSRRG